MQVPLASTSFSSADPMGTSHRNMERAGLRLHFLRTKWMAA
jgi:hypothetical protein